LSVNEVDSVFLLYFIFTVFICLVCLYIGNFIVVNNKPGRTVLYV